MSKNIKIGNTVYKDVEFISCKCADQEGVQRKFRDVDYIPETLIPSNVKKDVVISGVTGTLEVRLPEQEYELTLDLSEGNQVATPDEGKVYSKVTVLKPETLIPENIKKDVVIAGVTGIAKGPSNTLAKYLLDNEPYEIFAEDLVDVTVIPSQAFQHKKHLTSVTIPNGVTTIGINAFYECTSLTSITIPNSVTVIGGYAFQSCTSLTSIAIPDGVTKFETQIFADCISLTSITIPNSVTVIGQNALSGCTSLTSITIPNGVTTIGINAFRGCTSLTSVTMKSATPPSLGSNVFANDNNLSSIVVPAGCGDAYKAATGWSTYADKIVEAEA